MKFDLGDFNYKEQAELMNILNTYEGNNLKNKNLSLGFNEETIYNWTEKNNK